MRDDELETRRSVARRAMSQLFLDTELDEEDFRRVRDDLLGSGLDVQELDRIYYEEIAPLLHANLECPAGEWSGFDPDWLAKRIRERSGRTCLGKVPLLGRLYRLWITRHTTRDWQRLREMLRGAAVKSGARRV